MKTANSSRAEMSRIKLAQLKSSSVADSLSSKMIEQTPKTRNFGWLVTGMVETCQQMSKGDRD